MTPRRRLWVRALTAVIRLVLRVYPYRFRARFDQDILDSAGHDLDAAAEEGPRALAGVAAREIGGVVAGVIPEHRLEFRRASRRRPAERIRLHADALYGDLRLAIRSLSRSPTFTLVALAVLALGIGASTTIFSVVDAVVLRALPFDEPDRIVAVLEHDPARPSTFGDGNTTTQTYLAWREKQQSFDAIAAVSNVRLGTRNAADEPIYVRARRVTPEFFGVLRARPALGRLLAPEDEAQGHKVVVVSHDFWRQHFGGTTDAVGRVVVLDGEPREVVGVLPPEFSYPVASVVPAEVFVPLVFTARDRSWAAGRGYNFLAIARLKPGVSIQAASAELAGVTRALAVEHPKWYDTRTARVVSFEERLVSPEVRRWMLMLLGAVTFVLLISSANVANLLLARATRRTRELGIRAALGAGRLRLIRGLLVESLVLSAAGTTLGVLLGVEGVRVLKALLPDGLPRTGAIGVDWRVLSVAAAAAIAMGVLCGLVPALQASKSDLSGALREGGRSSTAGRTRQRFRSGLLVFEVALASVLVIGAGLFVASFVKLMRVDPGFDYAGVLTPGQVNVPWDGSDRSGTFARGRQYSLDVLAAISEVPGVESVEGSSGGLPFSGSWSRSEVTLPGRGVLTGDGDDLDLRSVSHGYLQLLRLPLRAGRTFGPADSAASEPVIVVNEAAANKYWPRQDAIGQRITLEKRERVVVGVVGNLRHLGLEEPVRQEAYIPLQQSDVTGIDLVVRARADPLALLPEVRAAIWRVNPNQRLGSDPATFDAYLDALVAERRLNMTLLSAFGALGLVIAVVGIYGVMAYVVSQRTTEFGVRMALGATGARLAGMVLGQTSVLVGLGLACGGLAAWWVSQWAAAFLFDLDARDVRVFAVSFALLSAAGLLAGLVPARRAARVDPLAAIRAD